MVGLFFVVASLVAFGFEVCSGFVAGGKVVTAIAVLSVVPVTKSEIFSLQPEKVLTIIKNAKDIEINRFILTSRKYYSLMTLYKFILALSNILIKFEN